MNSQTVTVNLVPGLSTPAVVRVSQYDYGRPILFKVMDGTMPASFVSGTVATVVGTKPSGLGFSEVAVISGNTASLDSTLAMTQECGMIPAEIRFSIQNGPDIGTANFILAVEPSPHPEGTTDGTQQTMADLETRLQGEIDDLSDRIDDIEAGGSGLSQTEKNLILTLFSKAAYAENDAETAYDALEALWATTTRTITYNLSHVSSSNTTASVESGQSYTTTLTASTNYTINSVTVTMGGVDVTSTTYSSGTVSIPSVTGNIVITATAVLAAQSITATYTQSGTVYNTDSLDSLKADLVVTANYSGGTSETIPASNYTLSGTLTVGTSTVTVSYAGMTDTFSVTVTLAGLYPFVSGSKTFEDGSVLTISNKNHVKFECKTTFTGSGANNPFFNVSNINLIETTALNNPESVNNKPKWFAFENAQSVNFKIDNVVATGSDAFEIQSNFRKANTSNSYGSALVLSVTSASGATKTATATATDISCAFLFFTKCTANAVYEFDMHLTVDGTKYF